MAILVDADTRLVVQGITGREGSFHAARNRDYGTKVVAGVTPGKGGQDVDGIPVFDTVAEAVAEQGANTAMVFVPPRFAADAIYEAVDAGVRDGRLHHRGHPRPRHAAASTTTCAPAGVTLLGPNCPGALSPGVANVGIIPAQVFAARPDRPRLALGHAHLPDRQGAGRRWPRQLDDRRHRRRPDRRAVVHRRARAVRGRPRDRPGRDGRRDRRRRGGEGGRLHRRAHADAGRRLHRRLPGAARQDDGPRRRDHLRLVRDGAGQEGGARGRGVRVGSSPTEAAQLAAEAFAALG